MNLRNLLSISSVAGLMIWMAGCATSGKQMSTPPAPATKPAQPPAAATAKIIAPAGPVAGQTWKIPDLELDMVWIKPGTFIMGSPVPESHNSSEEIQHQVTLTKGYWLGKYEVTQMQWQKIMGINPSHNKGDGRLPVERVSWTEAMEFCRKLTEIERGAGRLTDKFEYTLPTEAQWEFACRAGTTDAYAGELDAMAWHWENSDRQTHVVGQKQANGWGLYDMHGNVWEWCADWYGRFTGEDATDPAGYPAGTERAIRGGGAYNNKWDCRSANRRGYDPAGKGNGLGMRLCLVVNHP